MSITLHCDMCETKLEFVRDIIMKLTVWLVVRGPGEFDERHFCPKCRVPIDKETQERLAELKDKAADEDE